MKLFWREQIRERDIDTLKSQLRAKLGGYRVAINYLTTDNLLFRGVVWDEPPRFTKDVSYPPANLVSKNGRLNRIGQAMFYGSRGAPAVFYETHAKKGQRVAVSTWEIIEPFWMHNVGYHEDALQRIGAPLYGPRLKLAFPMANETRFNAQMRRQLSRAFTEDVEDGQEYRYKLSIAINELLFDGAEPLPTDIPDGPRCNRAGGTSYPAMQMRGAADNVAIWPEFVDRCLRLKSVSYGLVEAMDVKRQSYTVSSLAMCNEFSGNELIWRNGIADERRRRGHIAFENGHWVMRDGLNEIYDIH